MTFNVSRMTSTSSWRPKNSSARPRDMNRVHLSFSCFCLSSSKSVVMIASLTRSFDDPTKIRPSDRAAIAESCMSSKVSSTIGNSISSNSSLFVPAHERPKPMIEATRICTFLAPIFSSVLSSANAGSESIRTPELSMPIASNAPAFICSLSEYVYLSIWSKPFSMSHRKSIPNDAVVDIIPSSLVLKTQLVLSPSPVPNIILSLPKPAFVNPLTKALARLCLAESTLVSPAVLVLSKWLL